MHPWLLQHPPISTYGVCLVAGIILAWILARQLARRSGMDASRIDLLVPLLVGVGIMGAYLFGQFTDALTPAPAHGTVLYGSLLLATAAGIAYALFSGIKLGHLGDIMAAPICVGVAIGRLGCFFAGCCYGDVCAASSPLTAVTFPHGSFAFLNQVQRGLVARDATAALAVYPVQLYESALCALLAIIVCGRMPKAAASGERFLWVGLGYPIIRFALEFLRADNPLVLTWGASSRGFTFSQIISLAAIILAFLTLWIRRRYAQSLRIGPPITFRRKHMSNRPDSTLPSPVDIRTGGLL